MYLFFLRFPKKKNPPKVLKTSKKVKNQSEKIVHFGEKKIHITLQEVLQIAPNLVKGWSRGVQDPLPNFRDFILLFGEFGFFKHFSCFDKMLGSGPPGLTYSWLKAS